MTNTIEYKIPVARLIKNNKRSTLQAIIPIELTYYETHEKKYRKEPVV